MWYLVFVAMSLYEPADVLEPLPRFQTQAECYERLAEEAVRLKDEGFSGRVIAHCVQAEQEKEMLLG